MPVGFAAAVALSAMAVGQYLAAWTGLPPLITAAGSIVLLSLAHSFGTKESSRLQNILTALKLMVVLALGLATCTVLFRHFCAYLHAPKLEAESPGEFNSLVDEEAPKEEPAWWMSAVPTLSFTGPTLFGGDEATAAVGGSKSEGEGEGERETAGKEEEDGEHVVDRSADDVDERETLRRRHEHGRRHAAVL